MKKIRSLLSIAFVVFLFMWCGCVNAEYNAFINQSGKAGEESSMDISFTEIERFYKEWDQVEFPVQLSEDVIKGLKPIDTSQTALNTGVFIINRLHDVGKYPAFSLTSILHSSSDNIWVFEYSINQSNKAPMELIDCGCLYVVLNGNNGELIKAWIEE